MWLNHLKTSLRYISRNKVSSVINITGMAVALSASFLILQYLDFELSYDKSLPENRNVYRIVTDQHNEGKSSEAYFGVADWTKQNINDVAAATRFYRWPANTGMALRVDGKLYHEQNYLYADTGFFEVFPSLLVSGEKSTCLSQPNTIVVSERLAVKLFGTTDVLGKLIDDPEKKEKQLLVTGVMKSTPAASHFETNLVRPYEWIPEPDYAWTAMVWTYVRLKDGADPVAVGETINTNITSFLKKDDRSTVELQPVASIHLGEQLKSEFKAGGSMLNMYIMGGALMMILAIAWINYVNLETARMLKRLKDVGIRRIVGSSKADLLKRFLVEYGLMNLIAMILAGVVVAVVFSPFASLAGVPLSMPAFTQPEVWLAGILIYSTGVIITGLYPFISIPKLNAVDAMKGKLLSGGRSLFMRRSLLTVQFVASLTLMGLVVIVTMQLDFMRTANRNIDMSKTVTIYNRANYTYAEYETREEKNDVFRNKLMQIAGVDMLTTSSAIPGEPIGFTYTDLAKRSRSDADRQIPYKVMYIDYDFVPLFGLNMVAGRNYSREYTDTNCLVITESAAKELGFNSASEAINEKIWFEESEWEQWTVIGVVKDYRHESVKAPIHPGIFRLHRNKGQMVFYSIRMDRNSDVEAALQSIEKVWKETWPEKEFDYFFMDQHYDQQFKSEIRFGNVFRLFSGIAVFVACMGVMGMSLFEANSRMKEIGIRKILGATVAGIVALLTKESFRILVIASVVAGPLIWLLSSEWLSGYPMRVDFSILFVAVPLLILLVIAGFVSVVQVLGAALKNPVEHLKQE